MSLLSQLEENVMKTSKMSRSSNSTVECLKLTGERMLELASKISKSGDPLNPQEIELVRMSRLPLLQEILHDFKVQYLTTGYIDSYDLQNFTDV